MHSNELQAYYQKMADDYRNKYLALEKQFTVLEQIQDYEAQKQRQETKRVEDQLFERLAFEKDEAARRLSQVMMEKETYIASLQNDIEFLQQSLERESRKMESLERTTSLLQE